MDERAKFVLRVVNGESMTDLCREFGISRKTGYKIFKRFEEEGFIGLEDRKRGPRTAHNCVSSDISRLVLQTKAKYKTWGAKKIRHYLLREHPQANIPVNSTIHKLLDKNGLVKKKRRRKKFKAHPSYLSTPKEPNDLWCIDYKGQFKTQDRKLCYPLTITDQVTRFIIGCNGHEAISTRDTIEDCKEAFRAYGLPRAIRSDNGAPFSARTIWGLSKLSVFWLRLGIKLERIQPGKPQENGRHERMHRTLKAETTKPAKNNILQQQERFDEFKQVYNHTRPHEALNMKTPADFYKNSHREYNGVPEIVYDDCDEQARVSKCGSICVNRRKIFISQAFQEQPLGLIHEDEDVYSVYFMDYKLGYLDTEGKKLTALESPLVL